MVEGNQLNEVSEDQFTPESINEWPTHKLLMLEKKVLEARDASKYLFIWDKQGVALADSVVSFMKFKGQLAHLSEEIHKRDLGLQDDAAVAEFIRKEWVIAMRQGDKLCFDIDHEKPNFTEYATMGTFSPD